MRNLFLFLHLAGAIFWMGGMAFMVLALRPAAHAKLQPPVRLQLMVDVLRRCFLVVGIMAGLGIVMMLVFAHIFFAPWRRLRAAVAAQDWPEGGKRMNQIALLVKINLTLGWLAIGAVVLLG
jgi:uncharacterized membrane protein